MADEARSASHWLGGEGYPSGSTAPPAAPERSRRRGTILAIEGGEGLIDCPELASSSHGSEIAVSRGELEGFNVGDNVEFELNVTSAGAHASQVVSSAPLLPFLRVPSSPEAEEQPEERASGERDSGEDKWREPEEPVDDRRWCEGTIKSFDPAKGYGFISCAALHTEYGCDVFLHQNELNNHSAGDHVRFAVTENKRGQPQAADLALKVSQGQIKMFDADKGFGFIASPQVSSIYGRDAYLQRDEMNGFSVGDEVDFCVRLNKRGQPQAMSVSKRGAPAPAADGPRGDNVSPHGGKLYKGTIKMIDEGKGIAFINCPELKSKYERDVMVNKRHLKGFVVGDCVSFSVRLSGKGMPQASNLAAAEAGDDDPGEDDDDDDFLRSTGTIKSFNPEKGFGFITSAEAQERYGRDVFLHQKQVKSFAPGDSVSFVVRMNNNGHPQAYGLRECPKTVSWLAGEDEAGLADPNKEYVGDIKSFNQIRGYGFIGCPELQALFSRDVFIHQSQFEGHRVGDRVFFKVQVKKGQPQATKVAKAPMDCDIAASRRPTDPQASAALDRKLLRACASARADSPGLVEDLLVAGADPNARDVTGQTPLMVSALNVRHAERKCHILLDSRADLNVMANDTLTVLQWARERINPKFAAFLEGVGRGEKVDITYSLDAPRDDF